MKWFDYLSLLFGAAGIGCAIWFYVHLFRWGRLIRHGRIFITVKNKVRLNAPIEEWALWCRAAEKDKDHQSRLGRVIFDERGVKMGVLSKSFEPDPMWMKAWKPINRLYSRIRTTKTTKAPQTTGAVEGTWTAEDHTAKPVSNA